MMRAQRLSAKCLLAGLLAVGGQACLAADITGVWADDPDKCSKIFIRNGSNISFADNADQYGSGLVFDGNTIKGKMATCRITHRKADGDTLHLVATCATDIMFDKFQFSARFVGENKFVRIYPGVPELEQAYQRCTF